MCPDRDVCRGFILFYLLVNKHIYAILCGSISNSVKILEVYCCDLKTGVFSVVVYSI